MIKSIYVLSDQLELKGEIKGFYKKSDGLLNSFKKIINIESSKKRLLVQQGAGETLLLDKNNNVLSSLQIRSQDNLALDKQGDIYTLDRQICHCIKRISWDGKVQQEFTGFDGFSSNFHIPSSLVIDANNNVIIADGRQARVQKLATTGQVLWSKGEEPERIQALNLVLDSHDNIYVLTSKKVHKFAPDGKPLTVWEIRNPGIPAFESKLKITIDNYDRIYIQDSQEIDNKIKVFSTDGVFLKYYESPWPLFDRKGNTYQELFKEEIFDDDVGSDSYYSLQKINLNSELVGEWPFINSTHQYYGSGINLEDRVFDKNDNIYSIKYSIGDYNDTRIYYSYLSRLNPITGEEKDGAQGFQGIIGGLSIDRNSYLYVDTGQPFIDNYSFSPALAMFDLNLDIVGRFYIAASGKASFDKNNNMYLAKDGRVEVYSGLSTLKAPRILSAKLISPQVLALVWQDRTHDESGFKIQRAESTKEFSCDPDSFKTIKITKANVSSTHLPLPLTASTGIKLLCYRMKTVKGKEESLESGEVIVPLSSGQVIVNE
ncbi:MAG: hypothetical protein E6Q83_02695 [Thiothrix sp.]|nr:MAG: hypothetical protein E6Q83_02695 [Thiothrix sp.]